MSVLLGALETTGPNNQERTAIGAASWATHGFKMLFGYFVSVVFHQSLFLTSVLGTLSFLGAGGLFSGAVGD